MKETVTHVTYNPEKKTFHMVGVVEGQFRPVETGKEEYFEVYLSGSWQRLTEELVKSLMKSTT
jgi:hypothetical protein